MGKTIILLAGYPATGKSYFCNKIREQYPQFRVISQDAIKERLWDEYGFDSVEEKTALEMQSWEMFYEKMNRQMKEGEHLISAYPFSEKQRRRLGTIAEKNGYQVITIRLTGDIDVLYERSRKRDLSPSRHLGHLMAHYHKGDVLEDREGADMLVTYDIFRQRCLDRGYDKFELGHLIEVDVTSYDKIDYPGILGRVGEIMGEGAHRPENRAFKKVRTNV